MEIWKDIEGYEGLYQVSNMGRIKSLGNDKTRKEKILSLKPKKKGYIMVTLYKNSKREYKYVHRLVAENFLPNPNDLPEVNHKDENKENNTVYNLEWCTAKYNNNYGDRRKKASKSRKGKNCKKIQCIETGEIFESAQDVINKMFNGKGLPNYIRANICGQRKSSYGYHFKYIERKNY